MGTEFMIDATRFDAALRGFAGTDRFQMVLRGITVGLRTRSAPEHDRRNRQQMRRVHEEAVLRDDQIGVAEQIHGLLRGSHPQKGMSAPDIGIGATAQLKDGDVFGFQPGDQLRPLLSGPLLADRIGGRRDGDPITPGGELRDQQRIVLELPGDIQRFLDRRW